MTSIYALECAANKYYIGASKNIEVRLARHFGGDGCKWTKKYPPIKVIEIIPNCDEFDEDKYVKRYMKMYGIKNVRGGSYSNITLLTGQLNALNAELLTADNACFKCGSKGHYAADCIKTTRTGAPKTSQKNVICYKCHNTGHYANNPICPKNKPNESTISKEKLAESNEVFDCDCNNGWLSSICDWFKRMWLTSY